tara:strand:- start:478 stop:912 length:435 start_codon:yes stop_codon:yes gene_type:complete
MTVEHRNSYKIINLGPMEIWDGADLALLRETLAQLIDREGAPRVGVDMSHVKYVPSGFFGMLFDWCEQGASICLDDPCERVRNMIWFRQFMAPLDNDRFRLETEALQPVAVGLGEDADWSVGDPTAEAGTLVGATADSSHAIGL